MLTKRIIPCLDIRDGMVVKGVNFEGVRPVANPVELASLYSAGGADELVFYDITATLEGRGLFTEILKKVAGVIFVPLTVGGGISSLEDFDRVLKCGADKVSVNSSAIKNPALIGSAARKYGSQCVVLSMDVKRVGGRFTVFARGGRDNTGIDALEWAKLGQTYGAGELVINSIDADGTKNGFDLEMLEAISSRVTIPVIASGGAGKAEDFSRLFGETNISAGLAASVFHTGQITISELKAHLTARGIPVRI